jgi:SAM-dependent methyltransferase
MSRWLAWSAAGTCSDLPDLRRDPAGPVDRSENLPPDASLRDAWDAAAAQWLVWARTPGHDSYWRFHRDRFRELLPPPRGLTVDVGCGEGRLPRDLKSWGYNAVGVDASATLLAAAREADPGGDYRLADAATLPFADGSAALVTAFMSLQDVDDLAAAIGEIGRVLDDRGVACIAIVHPINSAGHFAASGPDAPFVISGSYLEPYRYADSIERDGLPMTFTSEHRPLQTYFDLLVTAGLQVDRLMEIGDMTDPPGSRWRRLPLFLDFRAGRTRV